MEKLAKYFRLLGVLDILGSIGAFIGFIGACLTKDIGLIIIFGIVCLICFLIIRFLFRIGEEAEAFGANTKRKINELNHKIDRLEKELNESKKIKQDE